MMHGIISLSQKKRNFFTLIKATMSHAKGEMAIG